MNRPGYPENWKEMTPEQKREWRQNKFIQGDSIKFVSPEAKKNYQTKARRLIDAYNVREPDQVPIHLPVGSSPYLLNGVKFNTAMYDIQKAIAACQAFNQKYAEELDYWASPFTTSGKTLEILDYKLYVWPGHGLSKDAPGYQFVEGEYMKAEEYDDLLRDPSGFWFRTYLPRVFGTFESFRFLPPLTDIIEIPMGQLMPLANPQVRETLKKLIQVSEDLEQRNQATAPFMGEGPARGYLMYMSGGFGLAPFDILGDTLRGTTSIMKDMYRRPDKLLRTLDVLADIAINSMLKSPGITNYTSVVFPLHKGADGWMSQKQFDTFYWPSLRKVINAYNNEGLTCTLFAEGSYNTRLEYVNDFPKGFVTWLFDQTDMARAKKILGKNCCIQGNVPSSLMVTGDPKDMREYCRKLIETCAPGGGYVLSAGCTAENPKLENLRAMLAAGREFGVYKK